MSSRQKASKSFTRLTIAAVAVVAAACGGSNDQATSSVITVDGSSTVFPITESIAEAFGKEHPSVRVAVSESGTGAGFQKFCRGETAMSDASRPITPAESAACTKSNISFIELPIAYDGLAVVVHPKNTWARTMTTAELKKLWEPAAQGQIKRWNQVRPGWPDQEVHLFGPGTASGTFDYFTEAINGKAKASRGDYTASEDDNVLVQGVSGDQYAIGYFGLAYFEQNRDRLALVAVDDGIADNGAGPIEPSSATVRGGTYRPLSRPLFVYVSTTALARPEVKEFVDFYMKLDDKLIGEVGYVPLAPTEQDLVRQRYAAKKVGSMFTNASHTASLESLLKGQ